MKNNKLTFTALFACCCSLFISCDTSQKSELITIPVSSAEITELPLSKIADKVESIELEVTDNSLIRNQRIVRVLYTKEYIIVGETGTVMLFDKTGKFIRKIGSTGQGPGEYTSIYDLTVDDKNELLFLYSMGGKIICYDFEGNTVKESPKGYHQGVSYIKYINNKLLLLTQSSVVIEEVRMNKTTLFTIDDNLLKSDSLEIRKAPSKASGLIRYCDFFNNDNGNIYFYYPDILPDTPVLDTLYQFKNDQLTSYMNLGFSNKGLNSAGEKAIEILFLYKSSRYVLSFYYDKTQKQSYCFCHDIMTGNGFNVEDGYMDDFHTKEKVVIRPFESDANMFYYLHTNIDDSSTDEPNPTLYIGTLKK